MASRIRITDQKICLSLDAETQVLSGYTEISLESADDFSPRALFFNARQMKIEEVKIKVMSGMLGTYEEDAKFDYINTHEAFEMKSGTLVRDTTHFSRVSQDIINSPELIIQCNRELPFIVHIKYTINPDSSAIVRKNGIIYTNNKICGPSSWFPCIDGLGQRSRYTLIFTLPKDLTCAAPGKEMFLSSDQSANTNTVRYNIAIPVQPHQVGFAIGDFKQHNVMNSDFNITYLYLAADEENFIRTMSPVPEVLIDVADKFNSEQFTVPDSIVYVYIPDLQEIHSFPGLVFYPSNYIVPEGNAAIWMEVLPRIYETAVGQIIYFFFPISCPEEEWIRTGLVLFYADYCCETRYKHGFVLERRWNDMNYLMSEDIHPSVVLSAIDPATGLAFQDNYLKIKAKLLINMIASSMNNDTSQNTLLLLIRPKFQQALEQPIFMDSSFYRMIKQFSQITPKTFKQQWLESNGMPIFTFNFHHEIRSLNVKFTLYQTPSCKNTHVKFFTGGLTVQLRDLENTIEQKLSVERQMIQQQLKYFTHRNKKKDKKIDFVDGTSVSIPAVKSQSLVWLILDPQHTWILKCRPRLPEYMILSLFEAYRDVYTQHETLAAINEWANSIEMQDKLEKLLKNQEVFYGVRGHIAKILALFSSENTDSSHKKILLKWYKENFFKDDKPKSHSFNDINLYLVQLDVIKAISAIRNGQDHTPIDVVEFLLTLMNESDNSGNLYTDDTFQLELSLALGRINAEKQQHMQEIEDILDTRVSGTQTNGGFCNTLLAARYTALTALILKIQKDAEEGQILTRLNQIKTIEAMIAIIFDDSPYLQCKADIFKCLLHLAFIKYSINFAKLFSIIMKLAETDKKMEASVCLREVYRFVLNSLRFGAEDRFDAYLLWLPANITRKEIISNILSGNEAIGIAETLWTILTVHAKYHMILRSECLRAYTTLFGKSIPEPYLKRPMQPITPLSSTNIGTGIQIFKSSSIPINKNSPNQPQGGPPSSIPQSSMRQSTQPSSPPRPPPSQGFAHKAPSMKGPAKSSQFQRDKPSNH